MRGKISGRWGISLVVAAAFLAGPVAAAPKAGVAAPEFTLTTLAKRKVKLSELRGKVVVVNYWATWCAPCKAEMPMMHEYFRANQARGLEMFGVTTEDSVPAFKLQKLASLLSYPLAAKINGGYGAIGNAVPSTYIIDRKTLDPLLAEAP